MTLHFSKDNSLQGVRVSWRLHQISLHESDCENVTFLLLTLGLFLFFIFTWSRKSESFPQIDQIWCHSVTSEDLRGDIHISGFGACLCYSQQDISRNLDLVGNFRKYISTQKTLWLKRLTFDLIVKSLQYILFKNSITVFAYNETQKNTLIGVSYKLI